MNEPNHNADPNPVHTPLGKAKERLATIFSRMLWLIPFVAAMAIANGLIELGKLPKDWETPLSAASRKVTGFQLGPYVCIMTGLMLLFYWGWRDGWEQILRFAHRMSIKAKWQQLNQEWMDREVQKEVDRRLPKAAAEMASEMAASQLSEARARARAEAFAQMGMADPAATDSPNDGSP